MNSTPSQILRKRWFVLDATVDQSAEEAVEYALMEAEAMGTEVKTLQDNLVITAYFAEVPDRERVRAELATALAIYDLPSAAVREVEFREIEDQDWLGEWKKSWQPVSVGKHFVIAPPWTTALNENRLVIRIEPGRAFGTGTHETTQLCLIAIEKYFTGGSFLDVGTGTGILAIAAAKLVPQAQVEAFDTDAEAIEIARENTELNGVSNQIVFRLGTIGDTQLPADCVCANLTADSIEAILPKLLKARRHRLILSGLLHSQIERIVERLQQSGIPDVSEIATAADWACIVV